MNHGNNMVIISVLPLNKKKNIGWQVYASQIQEAKFHEFESLILCLENASNI